MNPLALCSFEGARWLILNPNVPSLIYYSHLPVLITSIILAVFILFNNRKSLANQVLFFTLMAFATWVFAALVFWASNRSDVIMFTWSIDLYAEPLVYIGGFYLLYVLIGKRDLPFFLKAIFFALYLPIIIFVPTRFGLSGFDPASCLAVEGPIALYYTYVVEIFAGALVILYALYKLFKPVKTSRKEILSVSVGILLFLVAFGWGNIIGSFTENWQLGEYGLFGMPLFAAFLVYSIVKFKTFNIKLIAAQALVAALWILVPSILFVRTLDNVRIIVSITSVLLLILGIYLFRSVKKEVQQREQIAKMAEDVSRAYETEKRAKEDMSRAYAVEKHAKEELEKLDKIKNQFLAQTQHDLRTPLGIIRDYCNLLIDGMFGKQPKKSVEAIKKIQTVAQNKIKDVNNFLDTTQFQMGKKVILPKPGVDLTALVQEITGELKTQAESKGITFTATVPDGSMVISADREKLKAAIFNVIDNSIKYTTKGGVTLTLTKGSTARIVISDTGIGIAKDRLATLFDTAFERGEQAQKTFAGGRGIGLYLSSQIIKAHNGKIFVESEGEGKGSVFHIELPL